MSVKIAVVSLWAEDVPTTAHFYRDVIGLSLASHHGGRPHFEVGGAYLAILKGRPIPAQEAEPERFPILAFGVDNLNAAAERLRLHNIEMPWGIEEDGGSRWVMFRDPGGNLIELVEFI